MLLLLLSVVLFLVLILLNLLSLNSLLLLLLYLFGLLCLLLAYCNIALFGGVNCIFLGNLVGSSLIGLSGSFILSFMDLFFSFIGGLLFRGLNLSLENLLLALGFLIRLTAG